LKLREFMFSSLLAIAMVFMFLFPSYGAAEAHISPALLKGTPNPVMGTNTASSSDPVGLKSYSIDSYVISTNGTGKPASTNVYFEYLYPHRSNQIELFDALHPESGYDGSIGYIYAVNYPFPTIGEKTTTFNGDYTEWDTEATITAPEGVYSLNLWSTSLTTGEWLDPAFLQPVFIKNTAPTVHASAATTEDSNFGFSGTIADKYIDWKSVVENVFGKEYDINTKLKATYQVTNARGVVGAVTPFTLDQDASFILPLKGLAAGDNKVRITVKDDAQNSSTEEFIVTKTSADPPPGNGAVLLNGNPLANITFSVFESSSNAWYDMTTDANGNFTHNLPEGTYTIDGIWADPTWYPLNMTFVMKDGLHDGYSDLIIHAEAFQVPTDPNKVNVSGKLTINGNVMANTVFSFHTTDYQWYDTRTDGKGNFAFKAPDGIYQIDGIWDSALGKWYEINQSFTVQNGKLTGTDTLAVNITTFVVSGKITKAGQPLAHTTFSFHTTTGPERWYDATTDANGNFSSELLVGNYKLEGIWDAGDNIWFVQPTEFAVSGAYELNIDVPGKNVNGTLTKETTKLAGITFSFHNEDNQWYDVTTDANGNFSTFAPDGTYTIEGIWLESEWKWYLLGTQFTIKNGKLDGKNTLDISLSDDLNNK
jgi:hypothetical protein